MKTTSCLHATVQLKNSDTFEHGSNRQKEWGFYHRNTRWFSGEKKY